MNKGFTLVELLGVLVVLALISLITVISVGGIISNSSKSLSKEQIHEIEEAAKIYYLKEGMNINDTCVSVSELITKGYIEGTKIIDPDTEEEVTGYVSISSLANQYSYKYQESSCE